MKSVKSDLKTERNTGLDIVRLLATILVLTIHFFLNTNYFSTQLSGISMNLQSIIRSFCMSCVPLFMILTGYLNNKKEYNKSFFKSLFNILIIWLFYSILEFFVLSYLNKEISSMLSSILPNFHTLYYPNRIQL